MCLEQSAVLGECYLSIIIIGIIIITISLPSINKIHLVISIQAPSWTSILNYKAHSFSRLYQGELKIRKIVG